MNNVPFPENSRYDSIDINLRFRVSKVEAKVEVVFTSISAKNRARFFLFPGRH